jgi:TPR repeat protein
MNNIRTIYFPPKIQFSFAISIFFIVMMLGFTTHAEREPRDFDAGWKLYQEGRFSEAYDIWEPLAKAGEARAQFNLSVLYEQGRGIDANPTKAAYWNKQAVESGYPPALHNFGLALLAQKKNSEAIKYLREAADSNFAASQYTLGKIHQFGIGTPEDPGLAFKYVEMAANSGMVKAQYNLGKMYRDGYGVEVDEILSTKWFEVAASKGYSKAQNNIASRYGLGRGAMQNDVTALKWAILAAQGGEKSAAEKVIFFRSRMSPDDILVAETQANNFTKEK